MSDQNLHDQRKVKNYLLLALLLLFVVGIFAITMVKLSAAFNQANAVNAQEEANEEAQQ